MHVLAVYLRRLPSIDAHRTTARCIHASTCPRAHARTLHRLNTMCAPMLARRGAGQQFKP
jgi:hypothetical protein